MRDKLSVESADMAQIFLVSIFLSITIIKMPHHTQWFWMDLIKLTDCARVKFLQLTTFISLLYKSENKPNLTCLLIEWHNKQNDEIFRAEIKQHKKFLLKTHQNG